jgi:hypothetical protein
VPFDQTIDALKRLSSPDPYSRTKDHEGRRIEEVEGGWRILNYLKYRNLKSHEERRLQVREAVARYREKKANPITVIKSKPIADAEAYADAEKKKRDGRFAPPSVQEVITYTAEKGYHFSPEGFVAFYQSKGWKVGKEPMKDWKAACVTWENRWKAETPGATPLPEVKKLTLCRDCKQPMSLAETMESTRCRACRAESGV